MCEIGQPFQKVSVECTAATPLKSFPAAEKTNNVLRLLEKERHYYSMYSMTTFA